MNEDDRDLAIRTLIGEANGDPSQLGVAHVILNRFGSGDYNSVKDVVLAHGQFEPWSTRRRELLSYSENSPAYQRAAAVFDAALSGQAPDPTGGATHFYSPSAQAALGRRPPKWDDGTGQMIGKHLFFGGDQMAASVPDYASQLLNATSQPPEGRAAATDTAIPDYASQVLSAKGPAPTTTPVPPAPAPTPVPTTSPTAAAGAQPPQGILTAQPGESPLSSAAKNVATGAIRGVADIPGLPGNIGRLTDYLGDRIEGLLTGKPAAQVTAERENVLAQLAAKPNRSAFEESVLATSPSRWSLPTGEDIARPILAQTGEYVPSTPGERMVQAGAESGITSFMPGLGMGVRGAFAATGAGTFGQGAAEATGEPLSALALPAGAGVAGRIGGALLGRVSPETAALASQARGQYGIPLGAGQISESPSVRFANSVINKLPFSGAGKDIAETQNALNQAVSNTIGENSPKITPDVMKAAKSRIGNVFDDVAARTTIRSDPQFENEFLNTMHDADSELTPDEMRPLMKSFNNILGKFDNQGNMPGEAYNALVKTGSPLARAINDNSSSNVNYWAARMRENLDDAFQRSASPEDQSALSEARSQYRNLKTIEPLVAKAPAGDISAPLLMQRVNSRTNNGLAYGSAGELGDLAWIGSKFLKEPPSSGTAERALTMAGLGGLAEIPLWAMGYHETTPYAAAALPFVLGGGRLAGSALRSKWLANALINRSLGGGTGFGTSAARATLPYLGQSTSALAQ